MELTDDRRYEADLRDHLRRHAYDFVIGSVHVYRSSPYAGDRVAAFVSGKRLPEIVAPYFDEVEAERDPASSTRSATWTSSSGICIRL